MSAWWWTGLTLAGVVAVGVCRVRDALRARVEQHQALVDAIHAEDPEISQLEASWRLPARQPDHR